MESLKSELLSELQNILIRTTQTLIEAGPYSQGDARLLPELFGAVVEQFYLVIDSYRLLALAVPKAVDRHKVKYSNLTENICVDMGLMLLKMIRHSKVVKVCPFAKCL